MTPVAVLCAAERSVYKTLPGTVVYDKKRDARTFAGGMPVVAHPPCAQWSRLRGLARKDQSEADLAFFCLDQVRDCGGVLEHPFPSLFFKVAGLRPFVVDQSWFGFATRKRTALFIHGVELGKLPPMPFHLGDRFDRRMWSHRTQNQRAATSQAFAQWLLDLARSV